MAKIILVEDDPFLVDIYSTKLKEAGLEVVNIASGVEIVAKLKEEKPQLVILDIVLPKVDGWEILKTIKTDKETKDIKVIILSNLGQEEEIEKGLKLGAEKYLVKSQYKPSDVAEEVKKLL